MKNLTDYFTYLQTLEPASVTKEFIRLLVGADILSSVKQSKEAETRLTRLTTAHLRDLTRALQTTEAGKAMQQAVESFSIALHKELCLNLTQNPQQKMVLLDVQKQLCFHFLKFYTTEAAEVLSLVQKMDSVYQRCQLEAFRQGIAGEQNRESSLEQSNSFLSAILEHIPNMIFVKDAEELRFVKFNQAGEQLLGFNSSELIGKNDYDFFPLEQADFFTAKDRAVLISGKLLDISEEPIQTRLLGERWLHTKKIPIPAKNGHPAYLLGISEDITERKKQQDSIRELNQELEAFSYSVSHDLRAPLRAVNGYVQILEEDHFSALNEEAIRLIQIIKYNATKMETLIDDLLSFSRLGRKELLRTDIDMNELAEGVVREMNRNEPTPKARIIIQKLLPVKADYGLIHQVMANLLSNAVKYSSKKEDPQIEISSRSSGSEIIYEVKDNGAGFNMKYANKLFGVFQRLHRTDEFEGTGVGLAIVKRIVTRHGGYVQANGVVNEGATFTFSLPLIKG
ncbi:MAG TPA: ATP-binding protein [Bacteroidia bacterium]|jgi:PAS domain S-box-containing protein|nr:ATP-binding protein [Bacteroidia bacterium]